MRDLPQAESLPALAAQPKITLSHGPTPIEPLANLGRHLGLTLWAKRDDCNGLAFGGNKVRQLEYYLGQAADRQADTILITGAVQSNFVRLAAAAARRLGWLPVVQLEDRVPKEDPFYQRSGNLLLDQLLGATIHRFPVGNDEAAADRNLDTLAGDLAAQGRRPYVIHLGTEHPPIGGLGYVEAACETLQQLAETDFSPSHVVIPSGSGLTHAGFLVGARAIGWEVPVIGICVRREAAQQHPRVLSRAREIAALLGSGIEITPDDVIVDDSVLAPGYGRLNPETLGAIQDTAALEGIFLDPVYSGRCMAGLIHCAQKGSFNPDGQVLFIHTGGTPALFAYQNELHPAG